MIDTALPAKTTVLLVEDNPGDARLIMDMLRAESAGFDIHVVDRLATAMTQLAGGVIDVVLLDLGLPDSTGMDTFRRMHARLPGQAIVILSGLDDHQVALDAVRAGAQDYLTKGKIDGPLLARVICYADQRQHAEHEVRQNEKRFRQLTENIREVFYVMSADYTETVYISPAYEKIWGRSVESLYADPRSFLEPVPPEDRVRIVQGLDQARRGEDPGDVEFRIIQPDGSVRWVASTAAAIHDEAGKVYRITGVAMDITERKRAQADVVASEERLRTLFETMNLIVLALNAEGRVQYVNPFFLTLTGYTSRDVIGNDFIRQFIPPEQVERVDAARLGLLEEGRNAHYSNAMVLKSGGQRLIAWHNTVVRDGAGLVTGTLSIGEDVTERTSLQAQLHQSQKMEAVGRLAGGVAHDFNNLLTVISTYTELLLEGTPAEDPRREDLDQIGKAAAGAAGLTRQLLAFSRQEVIAPRDVDLDEIVAKAQKMLRRLIGEDVELSATLRCAGASIVIDPGQLEQVLMNLAVNARDAMPTGGKLTVETAVVDLDESYAEAHFPTKPGRYAMLAVCDTGVGMDKDTQARIFEPFFTTKEPGKGTGLGLASVYGVVKQSLGFIWVYSEPGLGTTFKLYWPLSHSGEHAMHEPADPVRGGTETIVVVEDSPAVRSAVRTSLERYGYTVVEASNGREALAHISRKGSVDLLFTDVVMPGLSGRELGEAVAKLRPGTRVLYMSGYTDDAVLRHGLLRSGISFIQKPFTPDVLARKVREVLDAPARVAG